MSDVFDLGPAPRRLPVGAGTVGRLVADQFPAWAGLPVTPVADGGWDNWTFHLGATMSVRLPSAAEYALAVEKEHRWLPALAPRLPLPVPVPVGRGEPGFGYPYSWSIYPWLDGRTASPDRIADPVEFAVDLAGFLSALQGTDPAGGPRPGTHNWFRGGPLRTFDALVQRALPALGDHLDVERAAASWQEAVEIPWDGEVTWLHGDVAQGNLLVDDGGRLAAVIDFGTCGVGDPACDLAIAWTVLTAEGREVFRDRLSVDEATWTRGRGWALWKALVNRARTLDGTGEEADTARRTLDEIFPPRGST